MMGLLIGMIAGATVAAVLILAWGAMMQGGDADE